MKFATLLLVEGREQDFLRAFGKKFSKNDLKKIFLLSRDIATNQKFLNFLGKALSPEDVEGQLNDAKETLTKFIKYQNVLDQRDINQFQSLDDIKKAILAHENKTRRDVKKLEDADQVYEDDRFAVVTPKTHKASCYYGAGTKWCTASMNGDTHFDRYNQDAKLFYIIDKKATTDNKFYKVALLQKYDGNQTFYDAPDNAFHHGWILGSDEWKKINANIQKYMNDEFSREIQIFKDKEAARLEIERVRQQQERERTAARLRDAQERKENRDWDLELHPDDEQVAKVNAVFKHLLDDNEVAEGEDIYYLLPAQYGHYNLDTYEWLGENQHNTTWAVGNDEEAEEAAKDYVKNLWDDMGAEAFSQGFVDSHMNMEQLKSDFYDIFYEDISNSPEIYFDSEDLGFSEKQKERLEQIEKEIAEYEYEMNQLDPDEDEDVIDDFQNLIDELDSERDDINYSPEGEATEEMIENLANERADDAADNYEYYMSEFGMDRSDYIDVDALIEDVVYTDGRGNLSPYDGSEWEERVNDNWYYVYQVD